MLHIIPWAHLSSDIIVTDYLLLGNIVGPAKPVCQSHQRPGGLLVELTPGILMAALDGDSVLIPDF